MANRLETAIQQHRAALRAIDRAAMAEVFSSYQDVMDRLEPLIELLQQEVTERGIATATELFKLQRWQELQRQTVVEMGRLADLTGDATHQAQVRAIRESVEAARPIAIASARGAAATAQMEVGWARLPTATIEDLVHRTSSGPLKELLNSFGEVASREIAKELIVGMALGKSPRAVADAIHRGTDIARNRALTIARTEMLRSARTATSLSYQANADILKGWYWICAKQTRTCGACLAMDGTLHPLEETLNGHPNCRCAMRPALRNGPARTVETGEQWLRRQPLSDQDDILGKSGGAAWRAGEVELRDFVKVDQSEDWGPSTRDGGIGWARMNAAGRGRVAA